MVRTLQVQKNKWKGPNLTRVRNRCQSQVRESRVQRDEVKQEQSLEKAQKRGP